MKFFSPVYPQILWKRFLASGADLAQSKSHPIWVIDFVRREPYLVLGEMVQSE